MVYVYAITDSPLPALSFEVGVGSEPLSVISSGRVAAVFSEHAGGTVRPTADNVWRHEQVVERLMRERNRAVLPARFGTLLGDEAKLAETLADHGGRLTAGLDRVRGCVELGLRVLWEAPLGKDSPPIAAADGSGRAYMLVRLEEERRRREERDRAERLAENVNAPLAALARQYVQRVLPTPGLLLSAAYLVPLERTEHFRGAVERLTGAHRDLRLLCTGPWPPYHFVPAIADAAEAQGV